MYIGTKPVMTTAFCHGNSNKTEGKPGKNLKRKEKTEIILIFFLLQLTIRALPRMWRG